MPSTHWHLVMCGISHKSSPLEEREPLQIPSEQLAQADEILAQMPGVLEGVVVSTCNRTEIYIVWDHDLEPFAITREFFQQFKQIDITPLENKFQTKMDNHCAAHLFRVTTGLDSMVIGEDQILGQSKAAYSAACSVKSAGKVLHRLFHQAFRVGKQVRSDTEMGRGACSVSSAAIGMLRDQKLIPPKPTVLLVGVNQMISLAANNLARVDHCQFKVANRTKEKADKLAQRFRGTGHSLDEIPQLLSESDIAVSCTSAEQTVIKEAALAPREDKPLVMVDLAIPRDIDPNVEQLDGVRVFDLEDIKAHVQRLQDQQAKEIPKAEDIIDRRMDEFMYWYNHVRHQPLYNHLDATFEAIRHQELDRVSNELPEDIREQFDHAIDRLIHRLAQIRVRSSEHHK